MKFIVLFCGVLFLGLTVLIFIKKSDTPVKSPLTNIQRIQPTRPIQPTLQIGGPISTSIFFPYWTQPESGAKIDAPLATGYELSVISYIYFGIAPSSDGTVNRNEPGFINLEKFTTLDLPPDANRILTLRMINNDINFSLLKNTHLQEKLINESIQLANQYNFDGILVDLELSAIPTDMNVGLVSTFFKLFSEKIRRSGLTLSAAIFGDTFYRSRPYDIATISKHVDKIYIMAYDFHKSTGLPGPNFPLNKADNYPYDLHLMLDDFTMQVNPDKLVVVFGLFGYDWKVDPQRRPFKAASALTLRQITSSFLNSCQKANCRVRHDKTSAETAVHYSDDTRASHEVWFETEQSVSEKLKVVVGKGIPAISFWAYGYY